jgi:hypothetical protein
MGTIYHAPSAESIIKRLEAMGLNGNKGNWGCAVYIHNGPQISIETCRSNWRNKRDYTLSAKWEDSRSRTNRTWIKFSIEDWTEDAETFRESYAYDREISDDLWNKFLPKLHEAIRLCAEGAKGKQERSEAYDRSNKLFHERCAWLKENAPNFSINGTEVRFGCYNFDEMKDRLKAAHAILFPTE